MTPTMEKIAESLNAAKPTKLRPVTKLHVYNAEINPGPAGGFIVSWHFQNRLVAAKECETYERAKDVAGPDLPYFPEIDDVFAEFALDDDFDFTDDY